MATGGGTGAENTPLGLSTQNSQQAATTTITNGTVEVTTSEPSAIFTRESSEIGSLDVARPNSLTSKLTTTLAALASSGSRTFTSPLGGSATVTVTSNSVSVTFVDFTTPETVLNGTASLTLNSGSFASGTYTGTATFTQLTVARAGQDIQIDGSATTSVVRTGSSPNFTRDSIFTSNFTITELDTGAFARFQNFIVLTRLVISGPGLTVNGTQSYNGTISYRDVDGLTGTVTVSTPIALVFSGSTRSYQVTDGQVLISGNGTVRLTVVAPNTVEVAREDPPGSGTFVVIITVSWSGLGGATSAP
jgi:hypothetical protein